MVWADLLVAAVSSQAPALVSSGIDADALAWAAGPGVELAEVVAGAAAALDVWLPPVDTELLAVVARDGDRVDELTGRGLLLVRPDGQLGFTVGRGQVVESIGDSVAIIQAPGAVRYTRGYRIPGFIYWRA